MSGLYGELPLAGERPERGDAALNRARILVAALRLMTERGPDAVTMDDVAAAAGVGKGTVFRRFGDRAGLTQALLDEEMINFQERFLSGPPPLGPGAAPALRLEAFLDELVLMLDRSLPLVLAADAAADRGQGVYAAFVLHVRHLIEGIDPELDPRVTPELVLGVISPWAFRRLRGELGVDLETIRSGVRAVLRGLTG